MPASLEQIIAATREKLTETRASRNLVQLEKQAEGHVPRGFRHALQSASKAGLAVIAELKKASPSRGLIRADFDPETLAKELEGAGASALSVLTDVEFFQGSLQNLRRASATVTLPCLRKDFILDESQIVEGRANGADAVLLIVAALSQAELIRLAKSAADWGVDVLCEIHDQDELQRAMDAGCNLIGVNSRDLRTFEVDLGTALRLGEFIPDDVVRVAESGIHTGADISRLGEAGYHAFLIGESLMRAVSPGDALRQLLAQAKTGSGAMH